MASDGNRFVPLDGSGSSLRPEKETEGNLVFRSNQAEQRGWPIDSVIAQFDFCGTVDLEPILPLRYNDHLEEHRPAAATGIQGPFELKARGALALNPV